MSASAPRVARRALRVAALGALLLSSLAACGEEEACAHDEQRFTFDGGAGEVACERTVIVIAPQVGSTRISVHTTLEGGELTLYSSTVDQSIPVEFELQENSVNVGAGGAWATGLLKYRDQTGPLIATAGKALLRPGAGHVVLDIEGTIARRDGQQRPFVARLDAAAEVRCLVCDAARSCTVRRHPACEPFEAALSAPARR